MPARRGKLRGTEEEISTPPGIAISAPHEGVNSDALDDDIEHILDEIGENGGAVILWREKDNAPGDFDYLIRRSAKGMTLEFVREQFGGGRYKMILVDPVHGPLNPTFFSIDARWIGKAFSNPASVVPGVRNDDGFRDRMMEILLTSLLAQRSAPPVDTSRTTVELIAALAPLLKGDSGNSTEMFKTMLESATTLASAMNPPEGFAGVAAGLIPAIDKLASAHQLSAQRRVARVLPPATGAAVVSQPTPVVQNPTVQTPTPATVAGSIYPKWLEPFRSLAPRLVSLADKDADPELYADLVIDALTDDDNAAAFAGAVDAMQHDTLLIDALSAVPQMGETPARKAWLEKFVDAVRVGLTDILNAPMDDDTEPAGESAANG